MTLADAFHNWIDIYKKNSVRPSTYNNLHTKLSIIAEFQTSMKEIDRIKGTDIQELVNDMLDSGLKISTVKVVMMSVEEFFRWYAYEHDTKNPCHSVRIPKQPRKTNVKFYNVVEQRKIRKELLTLRKPGYGALLLMLECGLRVGEATALMWDDIQWNRKAFRISRTMTRTGIQDAPKTESSIRTIPFSPTAYDAMLELSESGTDGFIFTKENGELLTYHCMRYLFNTLCDEIGVRKLGTHALRHTFATNCYANGADIKKVSKMLGHSTVGITYDVYVHFLGDDVEEMRTIFG